MKAMNKKKERSSLKNKKIDWELIRDIAGVNFLANFGTIISLMLVIILINKWSDVYKIVETMPEEFRVIAQMVLVVLLIIIVNFIPTILKTIHQLLHSRVYYYV